MVFWHGVLAWCLVRKEKEILSYCKLEKVLNNVFHNQNMIQTTPPIKTISLVFGEDMAHSLDEAEGLEVAEVVGVNFVRGSINMDCR